MALSHLFKSKVKLNELEKVLQRSHEIYLEQYTKKLEGLEQKNAMLLDQVQELIQLLREKVKVIA